MNSHGHSSLGSFNGIDEPITSFDLIIEARSQMRGQRAMQGGLGVSPGGLVSRKV